METLYFPKEIYILAHQDYLIKTRKDPNVVLEYCLKNTEFFVEVAFSFVDGLPYPEMKESA
jgi:hypothetical protein